MKLNGINLLPRLIDNHALAARDIFWEMNGQLAVRRGDWKLVMNGQLVENGEIQTPIHLANLSNDMSEKTNLAELEPQLVLDMKVGQSSNGTHRLKNAGNRNGLVKTHELVDSD